MSCTREARIFPRLFKQTIWTRQMSSSRNPGRTKNKKSENKKTSPACTYERDPLPLFLSDQVKLLLRQMTGFNLNKIMSTQYVKDYRKPSIYLVTDEELEKFQLAALKKALYRLHMPPVMKPEHNEVEIYSVDKEIAPFLTHKFVFTDISLGRIDRERLVTVRDIDGIIRPATPEEKRRACQIYSPKIDRKVIMPKMFEPEHLENILHEYNYRYILDRACLQFEPDNPDFIRVCNRIYDHIAENRKFHYLRSTRFFGPMAFYYAWTKNIEPLLIEMIQNNLIDDATDLLQLLQTLHPQMDIVDKNTSFERKLNEDVLKTIENDKLKEKLIQFAVVKDDSLNRTRVDQQIQVLKKFCKNHASKLYKEELEFAIKDYTRSLDEDNFEKQEMV